MTEISGEKSLPLSSNDVSSKGTESSQATRHTLDSLSDDILLKILKLLDTRSLCRCLRVNKRFYSVAQDPLLYTSLDLEQLYESIDDTVLDYLAPRCPYLWRLNLTNCGNYDSVSPEKFKNFLRVCGSSLTELGLRFSHFVDDSVMQEIPLICHNLKKLDLHSCKVTDNGFRSLTALETLESFEIFAPDIEQATLIRIIQKNRKIRHLDLRRLRYTDVDAVARAIADSCPDLESLIWPYTRISHRGMRELARCTNLRHLNIASCSNIFTSDGGARPQRALQTLFASCIHLETVSLATVYYFTDEDLEPLLSCPIEELDLAESKYITADMCSRFFLSWPRLRKINLKMCNGIRSTNVREWQRQYPNVSIKYEPYRPHITKCRLRRFNPQSPYSNLSFGNK